MRVSSPYPPFSAPCVLSHSIKGKYAWVMVAFFLDPLDSNAMLVIPIKGTDAPTPKVCSYSMKSAGVTTLLKPTPGPDVPSLLLSN